MNIQIPNFEQCPDLCLGDMVTHLVPERLKAFDKELYRTKWWDYRFDTPYAATLRYIDAFGAESRKLYARDIDSERAEHIHVVTGAKVVQAFIRNEEKAKKAFSSFWRGRQVADALGMPYEAYIYEALSQRMRHWQRAYIPAAGQIYQDAIVERVSDRWEAMKASRVYYADHHAFIAQNYQATPIQKEYCDYLFKRAEQTGDKIMTLADMVDADHLPLEYLEAEHQGVLEKVRASLS